MVFIHMHVIETLFKFWILKRSENVSSLILVDSAFHQHIFSNVLKDMIPPPPQKKKLCFTTDLVVKEALLS